MKHTLFIFLALGASAALSAAPISYLVTVDSSSIAANTPGFIELQFNQANASTSLAALASVSNFSAAGFAFDDLLNFSLGGVSGSLFAPPLVFDNTVGGSNLFDQGVTSFGSGFSFVLTLEGDALATPSTDGSQFFVYLLDTNYGVLAGPTDGSGIAGVTVNGDTSLTLNAVQNYSTVTAAPEPGTIILFSAATLLLLAKRRNH